MSQTSYFQLEDPSKESSKKNLSSKAKKKMIGGILVACSILILLLVLLFVVFQVHKTKGSKKDAVRDLASVIDDAAQNNLSQSNVEYVGSQDMNRYEAAFYTFDENNDLRLDTGEFMELYQYSTNLKDVFEIIDIDSDGVLAYREVIIFLKVMSLHDGIASIYSELYSPLIELYFNYSIKVNQSHPSYLHDLDVWYEYLAALWFTEFDPGYKGYVTYSDYATSEINDSFATFDINLDGFVDFTEFVNKTLGGDGIQILDSKNLITLNDENKEFYMNASSMLRLYDVENLELFTCSNMKLEGTIFNEARRRLQIEYACVGTGIVCGAMIGVTLWCCTFTTLVTMGASCGACTLATIGACVTAGGTCAAMKIKAGVEGGLFKYPVNDFEYCIQFHRVSPYEDITWSKNYEGSTMGYPDIYVDVYNGCEHQYTSTVTPKSEFQDLIFDDKLCFTSYWCGTRIQFSLYDKDTFNHDDLLTNSRWSTDLSTLTSRVAHNTRGMVFDFMVKPTPE